MTYVCVFLCECVCVLWEMHTLRNMGSIMKLAAFMCMYTVSVKFVDIF